MVPDLNIGSVLMVFWVSWPLLVNYFLITRHLKKTESFSFWKPDNVFLFCTFIVMLTVLVCVNVIATAVIVQHGSMDEAGLIWAYTSMMMIYYGIMIGMVCMIFMIILNKLKKMHKKEGGSERY